MPRPRRAKSGRIILEFFQPQAAIAKTAIPQTEGDIVCSLHDFHGFGFHGQIFGEQVVANGKLLERLAEGSRQIGKMQDAVLCAETGGIIHVIVKLLLIEWLRYFQCADVCAGFFAAFFPCYSLPELLPIRSSAFFNRE